MPGWDLLLPFFAATIVFAIMPGPALLFTAAQTMTHGRSGGLMAAFGLHLGGFFHVIAAAAGLSALLAAVPTVYTVLKFVGAGYLIYLGLRMILTRDAVTSPVAAAPEGRRPKTLLQSITVEVLNPKTALFFIAFLPQFVDPAAALPIWAQMLILGVIVNMCLSSADLLVVLLTSSILNAVKRGQGRIRAMRWAGGSILIGLGVNLALSQRS